MHARSLHVYTWNLVSVIGPYYASVLPVLQYVYIKLIKMVFTIIIAEPKGEASNRDALSSPVCMYVCIYVYPSHVNPIDCAIVRCSPQVLTTIKRSTWPPSATKVLNVLSL